MSFRLPLAGLLLLATLSSARADEPRLPVAASARPLAIGRLNLLLGAEPGVLVGGTSSVYQAILPLRFGFTEDFEFFAGPIAQTVSPTFHDPALGILYRLLGGPVELGLRAAGDLSLFDAVKTVGVQLGVPARVHIGSILAIDLGAHVLVGILPQSAVGLLFPAGVSFNITDALFIAAASGARVQDLANTSATFTIPLTATLGYTIAWGDRPFIDLAARAAWDEIRTAGTFTVGASGRIYLYF